MNLFEESLKFKKFEPAPRALTPAVIDAQGRNISGRAIEPGERVYQVVVVVATHET